MPNQLPTNHENNLKTNEQNLLLDPTTDVEDQANIINKDWDAEYKKYLNLKTIQELLQEINNLTEQDRDKKSILKQKLINKKETIKIGTNKKIIKFYSQNKENDDDKWHYLWYKKSSEFFRNFWITLENLKNWTAIDYTKAQILFKQYLEEQNIKIDIYHQINRSYNDSNKINPRINDKMPLEEHLALIHQILNSIKQIIQLDKAQRGLN